MILKLKSILPNPFRDLKTNPLIEAKIEELVGSINLTGFWDNVVVRKNADGSYELAYGHHRLAAAIRTGLIEADFIVKNLDDATMIQIMDNENRDTYGSTPASLIESVKAIVKALAAGLKHKAFDIDPKTPDRYICYAPSFVPGKVSVSNLETHRYTVLSIGKFLGRTKQGGKEAEACVVAALNALYLKEKGRFTDALLTTKDRTGAKVPITTNELLKITTNLKRDVERVEARKEETAIGAKEFDAKQRELAKAQKEAEEKAEAERKRLVDAKAAAIKAENEQRAKDIQARLDAKDAAAKVAAEEFVAKNLALEVKMAEAKTAAAEAKREDAYLPIRREVARIVHKVEQLQESLKEEAKAIARQPLNLKDREQLWQASDKLEGYANWLKSLFITSTTKQARRKNVRYTKC